MEYIIIWAVTLILFIFAFLVAILCAHVHRKQGLIQAFITCCCAMTVWFMTFIFLTRGIYLLIGGE